MAKLIQVSTEEIDFIKTIDNNQILTTFRPGTKFRIPGDHDPWHIVNAVDDKDICLIVYKSWSKYKQRWVYRVEDVFLLLWELALKKELYKDKEGNFVIKDKKIK